MIKLYFMYFSIECMELRTPGGRMLRTRFPPSAVPIENYGGDATMRPRDERARARRRGSVEREAPRDRCVCMMPR